MEDQEIRLDNSSLFGFSQFEKVADASQNIRELHSKSDEDKPPIDPAFPTGDKELDRALGNVED